MKKHRKNNLPKEPMGHHDMLELTLNLIQIVISAFLLGYSTGKRKAKKEE